MIAIVVFSPPRGYDPGVSAPPVLRSRWLVLDTETTGLPRAPWTRPCELAVCLVEPDGDISAEWASLVRVPCPPEADPALRLTGITREEINAAPSPEEVAAAFLLWRQQRGAEAVQLTSFNVGFDRPMMERLWPDLGPWGPCVMLSATKVMDRSGALQRWESGEPKWARLDEAARFFGITQDDGAHRALADARVAARLLVQLARTRNASR